MQDLGLPGDDFVIVAGCCQTINNRGEVVGFSFPGPLGGGRAIVWVDKVPVDLNTLIPAGSPWYLQFASSINDAGEIVGWGTINAASVTVTDDRGVRVARPQNECPIRRAQQRYPRDRMGAHEAPCRDLRSDRMQAMR